MNGFPHIEESRRSEGGLPLWKMDSRLRGNDRVVMVDLTHIPAGCHSSSLSFLRRRESTDVGSRVDCLWAKAATRSCESSAQVVLVDGWLT